MINHFDSISNNVLSICLTNPRIIGNYNSLIFLYWQTFNRDVSNINELTSITSIARCYRKLCQTGQIPLSDIDIKKRNKFCSAYKKHFAKEV